MQAAQSGVHIGVHEAGVVGGESIALHIRLGLGNGRARGVHRDHFCARTQGTALAHATERGHTEATGVAIAIEHLP